MTNAIISTYSRVRQKIGQWTDRALQHTPHHYLCYFPEKPGWLASHGLRFFFSGIRFGQNQIETIRRIPEDGIIVYAGKYKSYFEYLFLHTRYGQEGLPVPVIGFDYKITLIQPIARLFRIFLAGFRHFFKHFSLSCPYESGYIRDELKNGKSAFLSLVEEGGFYQRFVKASPDPLRYLIEMQQEEERPVYIVPQLVFYSRKPPRSTPTLVDIFFGSQEKPGYIRRFVALFQKPVSAFAEVSEPFNLKDFMTLPENRDMGTDELALTLRRKLLDQMNRHYQSIIGPVLKSVEELKEEILTTDRLREYIEHYAANRNIPIYKANKEAAGYVDEVAAKYSLSVIQVFSFILKGLIRLMFDGVSVNTDVLNRIKSMSRRGPLILVPCHKSHIDYLVLSYIMYHNDMPCPHIAAGKNLSFWPMGPLFRGGGAFFIRRTFKGAMLYSKVFGEYIYKLLEEGFNMEFFIEGGRSRTGKLLQPKLGLLSILLNAYRQGACEDLIFVPVFIGYDRVPEEASYLRELEGGEKKPESLSQMLRARKALKKRYGRIYIQFHDGISLNDMLAAGGKSMQEMSSKEQNVLCRNLGFMMINAIDKAAIITPHAVFAAAILSSGKQRFSCEQLMENVQTYMNYLMSRKAKLADTLLVDQERAFEYVMESYVQRKFIEPIESEGGEENEAGRQFTINPSRRAALGYYSNNCAKAFIPAAFTAMSIIDRDAFQFAAADIHQGYAFFQDIFRNEFAAELDASPEYMVQKNIKVFIDEAILMPHPSLPDTYNLTAAGFRKLKVFAAFLAGYFESYWITLNFFMRYPQDFVEPKDRLKKIQSMGNRMYKKKEVEYPEALSLINYQNAMDFFIQNGVRGSDDEEKARFYADVIRRCLNRLQS